MTDVRDLYVYPWPVSEATAGRLRAVKVEMDTEYLIVPKEAQPGTGGRVVAFKPVPWIVADGIGYVTDIDNTEALKAAIAWGAWETEDKRALTVVRQLEIVFGPGVEEIYDSQLAYERLSTKLDLANEGKVKLR